MQADWCPDVTVTILAGEVEPAIPRKPRHLTRELPTMKSFVIHFGRISIQGYYKMAETPLATPRLRAVFVALLEGGYAGS
jgi:hypothetical protein